MILFSFFLFVFLLICLLLSGVILLQESKSTGLGASFGSGGSDSLFGASTVDVLQKFTAALGAVFVFGCIALSIWSNSLGKVQESLFEEQPLKIEQREDIP
ncbi:MAG: preprotein translocase subunit SecG [Chlamydiota bacterium]